MSDNRLPELIGNKVLVVAAHYRGEDTRVYICGAMVRVDNSLTLILPHGHQLQEKDKITVHLDNRTGISEYDEELSVYRLSYKGQVQSCHLNSVEVRPVEFQVFYGISMVLEYRSKGYLYPDDYRQDNDILPSPLQQTPVIDQDEHENKIGVLITRAQEQPHTTVMAFLSSKDDDIFMITFPETFKSKVLKRDKHCYFAIDNRASFTFEEAIEWNYSIIEAEAFSVSRANPLFAEIQELFIMKNPWEVGFFSRSDIEMYHLQAKSVVCSTKSVGTL